MIDFYMFYLWTDLSRWCQDKNWHAWSVRVWVCVCALLKVWPYWLTHDQSHDQLATTNHILNNMRERWKQYFLNLYLTEHIACSLVTIQCIIYIWSAFNVLTSLMMELATYFPQNKKQTNTKQLVPYSSCGWSSSTPRGGLQYDWTQPLTSIQRSWIKSYVTINSTNENKPECLMRAESKQIISCTLFELIYKWDPLPVNTAVWLICPARLRRVSGRPQLNRDQL